MENSREIGDNLDQYELSNLKSMFDKEKADLTEALLNGADWNSLREQRQRVTALSIAIHKKNYVSGNPAEVHTRKDNRD